ncbi:MAG TPA: ATP synthase F0 subunit B [Kofleriaceae bacterium]|nr:ATP synthase F0 subunit B [Kofleriaceae bacterium]
MKRSMFALAPLALALGLGLGAGDAVAAPSGSAEPHAINWFEFGYKDLDVQGHQLEPGAERMAPPLLMALINFAIFGFILVWKAGPPITRYLSARHTEIKHSLEEGQRLRDEASEKLAGYTAKIAGVEREVDALINDIRASAETEKKRIIADAERQAESLKKNAEAQIAAEVARARAELEREVLHKAVEIAEQILREKATATDQQKLVDTFMADLVQAGEATSPRGEA